MKVKVVVVVVMMMMMMMMMMTMTTEVESKLSRPLHFQQQFGSVAIEASHVMLKLNVEVFLHLDRQTQAFSYVCMKFRIKTEANIACGPSVG
jgi:hypothetical protein